MYKGIIFDFFGVICSEIAPEWFGKHFPEEEAIKLRATSSLSVDLGTLSLDEYFSQLGNLIHTPAKQIEKEFYTARQIDSGVVDIIKELRGKYPIALCSNASDTFLNNLLAENNLKELFDVIVVSSTLGIAKPDKRIYEEVLRRMKLPAEEVVFIDDNPLNINGATEIGIKGIVFQSAEQLKKDLISLMVV